MPARRLLHPPFILLFRLLTALSLLLLLPITLLWILSYTSPRQLDHNLPQDQLRLVLTRGGFWYLNLRTRPADASPAHAIPTDPPPPSPHPPDPPFMGSLAHLPDPNWAAGLKPDQTGPLRLGFANHLRTLWQSAVYIDPATQRPRGGAAVTEERIARIPLAAPFSLLALLPLTQLALHLCRRARAHRQARATAQPLTGPGPVGAALAYLFGLAALASTLLLTAALWQSLATYQHETRLTATTSLPSGNPNASALGGRFQAALIINRDGYELSRSYASDAEHRLPPRPTFVFTLESPDARITSATVLAGYNRADIKRLLGFAVASQDVPPPAPPPTSGTRFFIVCPGMLHRTGHALLIPHYAACLATALLPAAWLLRQRTLHRRARRLGANHCPHCGYDLRATPNRCPECGLTPTTNP